MRLEPGTYLHGCNAGYTFIDTQCILTSLATTATTTTTSAATKTATTTTTTTTPTITELTGSALPADQVCSQSCTYGIGGCKAYADDGDLTTEILCDRHIGDDQTCASNRVDCGPDKGASVPENLDGGVIAGATIGGVFFLLLLLLSGWWVRGSPWYHRRKRSEPQQFQNQVYENSAFGPETQVFADHGAGSRTFTHTYESEGYLSVDGLSTEKPTSV